MVRLKTGPKTELLKKALHIWAVQYHFVIPREILKMYIGKFLHERKNISKYGCQYFDPADADQYRKWLQYHPAEQGGKLRKDISRVGQSDTLSLSGVDTEFVLIISDSCHSYPNLGFIIPKDGDLFYFDHDHRDSSGLRKDPVMKPDFSYNTLRSFNYIGRAFVVRTELMRQFEGEKWNPYRWLLKLSDQHIDIRHISEIAYSDSESFACEAETLNEYLNETGTQAQVSVNPDGISCTVRYHIEGEPLVSIMIPTKDSLDVLKTCVESILEKSTYRNYEILIGDNNSEKPETFEYFSKLESEHENIRVIRIESPFNFSYINNRIAEKADGDYLVMLNNDTEIITPDWLEQMLGYAQRGNVGSVGAKLYYGDDTIQHGGVIIGKGGAAAHRWYRCGKDTADYLFTLRAPNDVACVTAACLMTSAKCWQELNGLNEELSVQYNDVDFGLRLLKAGYYNVFLPSVELYHYESKSRGIDKDRKAVKRFFQEVNWFKKHYPDYIRHDPFYNDNLDKNYDYKLIAGRQYQI